MKVKSVNCKEAGTEGPGSKLVLPAGTPVLWIFIDRFSQFNIISSKANSGAATEEEGVAAIVDACTEGSRIKLVLPAGTPVLWIFIDRFSQFNIISSKANSGAATEEEGVKATEEAGKEGSGGSKLVLPAGTCFMDFY